jgi:hypothetical protein
MQPAVSVAPLGSNGRFEWSPCCDPRSGRDDCSSRCRAVLAHGNVVLVRRALRQRSLSAPHSDSASIKWAAHGFDMIPVRDVRVAGAPSGPLATAARWRLLVRKQSLCLLQIRRGYA